MRRATHIVRLSFAFVCALLLSSLLSSRTEAQSFVQVNSAVPSAGAQVPVVYSKAQSAGDLNVVVVGWNDTTASVTSVTDTSGNSYTLATGPLTVPGNLTQSIYFSKNIVAAAAGANTVTVKFTTSATYPDIRILEYSGLDTNNPFDGATGATASSATSDSGALATTNANDLLFGANIVLTSTAGAGTGYTLRTITNPDGDLAEDEVVSSTGSYHATAPLTAVGSWIMQIVAFKAAGAAPAPTAPANLSAAVISSTQINLTWTASTETGGTISNYLVERCQGAGCSNFAQIGSSTTTSYNDTTLAASTTYSYRLRAEDTSNNTGPYSNIATATTQGASMPTPSAPANLTAVAGASGPIVVATQGYKNTNSLSTHTTAAFNTTGADVLVMCASTHDGVNMMPSDSLGNTWVTLSGPTSTTVGADLRTQTWYARNPTVGPNYTVTMTLSAADSLVISVIAIQGSNIPSPIDAASPIGSDNGTQTISIVSPSITTSDNFDLLVGFAKTSGGANFTAGSGFTAQPNASSNFLFAETGPATTPGSYDATVFIDENLNWQAAVVAVSPSAAASSADQVNLSWTASTETGGTIANYLVERCSGASCSSFAQIGTSTTTTYTDTTVTAGSYSYRVRAIDTNNNTGPYSNIAGVTMAAPSGPTITSLSPTSGPLGTSVTILGTNFGSTQGTSTVTFNGVSAGTIPAASWTNTSITAQVPTGATTGNVVVTVSGLASNGVTFQVAPTISSLSPTSGSVGTSVTISGANFGATQGTSTVTFNGTSAGTIPVASWTSTSITAKVPAGATTGNAVVTVGGLTSNGINFTVTVISISVSPTTASVEAGSAIAFTATLQNDNQNLGPTWSLSGPGCSGLACGSLLLSAPSPITYVAPVTVPSPPTVTLTVSSVADPTKTATATITITPGPMITSMLPTSGLVGTVVTISGAHFGTTQGASSVTFNCSCGAGIGGNPTSWSDTSILVPVPAGAATGTVSVTVGQAVASAGTFTVTVPAPSIASVNPSSGPVGASVTISGTNFGASQGTSAVTFNGVSAGTIPAASWTSTSITAAVPAGAATGSVVVTVGGIASNGLTFTVTTPTAPASLTATAASSSQINLAWTGSTETGGTISSYLVERCQSAGCTSFAQIGTSTTTTYNDTGLAAGTSYSYRVRAKDALGNTGPYSNTASATTQGSSSPPAISFVQVNSAVPAAGAQVAVAYIKAQTAGDLNVVIVGWNDTTASVTSVTDTSGNLYTLATGPIAVSGTITQSIYYAKNIAAAAAGATVTVKFSSSATYPDIRILEYSGLDPNNPLDDATGATGNSATADSGALTTTNANDLLVGANIVVTSTSGAGAGYIVRIITNPDGDIAEDQLVTSTGSYHATAPLAAPGSWIMQIVAFKAASN